MILTKILTHDLIKFLFLKTFIYRSINAVVRQCVCTIISLWANLDIYSTLSRSLKHPVRLVLRLRCIYYSFIVEPLYKDAYDTHEKVRGHTHIRI